ncbi:MAG: LysM peptidoglycan-binding domain-containing protein [Bacteroidales bacterium]|nr:LysM peptidoglycan-binding domain-containing protein [Bacteroidales bacterium]
MGLDTLNNDPKFIHASNHGVRYSSIYTESYYANRLLGARRILPDFIDYDVEFDSTATYAFNPDEGVHIAPDSLVLASGDRRIVLFENGKWAWVEPDGTLVIPGNGKRIILSEDGNWAPAVDVIVTVPAVSLRKEEPAKDTPAPAADTSSTPSAKPARDTSAAAANQAPAQPQQPEKVYHTVVKGDTLSKIARKHGTTVNKICQLNGISSTTILKVGRKLRVK